MRILTVGCIAATAASYASFAPTTAPRVGAPIHTALPDCGFRAVRQPLLRARRRRCAVEAHLTCIVDSRSHRSREVTQRDGPVRAAGARVKPCAAAAAAATVSWVHAPASLPQHVCSRAANTLPGPCPSAHRLTRALRSAVPPADEPCFARRRPAWSPRARAASSPAAIQLTARSCLTRWAAAPSSRSCTWCSSRSTRRRSRPRASASTLARCATQPCHAHASDSASENRIQDSQKIHQRHCITCVLTRPLPPRPCSRTWRSSAPATSLRSCATPSTSSSSRRIWPRPTSSSARSSSCRSSPTRSSRWSSRCATNWTPCASSHRCPR